MCQHYLLWNSSIEYFQSSQSKLSPHTFRPRDRFDVQASSPVCWRAAGSCVASMLGCLYLAISVVS